MNLVFSKYHGTGNDFVLVDGTILADDFSLATEQIKTICDRRFGIGADGLMILKASKEADFFMDYYNSDGNRSTMCGNGGRCISKFAFDLDKIKYSAKFIAVDGLHHTEILSDGIVSLEMNDVTSIRPFNQDYVLDSGSPHYIRFIENFEDYDIDTFGRQIRYSPSFKNEGINVNLVKALSSDYITMQSYERGVEGETYSCGTGMVAAAICLGHIDSNKSQDYEIIIQTKGGKTKVTFHKEESGTYTNVRLVGPAVHVFDGNYKI